VTTNALDAAPQLRHLPHRFTWSCSGRSAVDDETHVVAAARFMARMVAFRDPSTSSVSLMTREAHEYGFVLQTVSSQSAQRCVRRFTRLVTSNPLRVGLGFGRMCPALANTEIAKRCNLTWCWASRAVRVSNPCQNGERMSSKTISAMFPMKG
jgi:hypothetical protein